MLVIFLFVSQTSIFKFSQDETNLYSSSKIEKVTEKIIINPCEGLSGESLNFCELKNQKCETDTCYFQKAQINKDESICFEIKDENLRVGCSVVQTETKVFVNSVKNNDITICNSLTNNRVDDCRDNYYLSQKYNYGNTSLCNSIKNQELLTRCLE